MYTDTASGKVLKENWTIKKGCGYVFEGSNWNNTVLYIILV